MNSAIIADTGHPLSPLQEGILFDSVNGAQAGIYFEQAVFVLRGPVDAACLKQAWQYVVNRHAALRTRFVWEGQDKPYQEVMEGVSIAWQDLDWRSVPPAARPEALDRWLKEDRATGFALSQEPPLRLALIRLESELHSLVLSSHHVLLDRWSIGIIVSEVVASYESLRRGTAPSVGAARPYRDYIDWIQRQDFNQAKAFWTGLLQGLDEPTSIARVCETAPQASDCEAGSGIEDIVLPQSVTASLRQTARSRRLTLNTVTQGAWALLLSRYTGTDDVVYGLVVSGRPPALTGVTSIVGLFINTLPVRIRVSPTESILTMLQRLQRVQVQINQFEYSPLVDIKAASETRGTAALFDTLYVFQNLPAPAAWQVPGSGLRIESGAGRDETNYPLALLVVPGDRLLVRLRYDPSRLPLRFVRRMASHLEHVLSRFSAEIEAPCGSVSLLTGSERAQVVEAWNDTASAPPQQCVHELVAAQAQLAPEATAVVCGDESLTYRELEQRANRLAAHLRSRGVGAETTVAVLMGRSINLMVALLGILKAGGAYVPLDAASPRERLATIVRDSAARLVIVDGSSGDAIPDVPCERIDLDQELPERFERPIDVETVASMEQAAYVIYTSGSTGRPKGVVVSHRGLSNYLAWCLSTYPIGQGRGALVSSSIGFDLTITGLFAPLIAGGEVWLVPDHQGPEGMASVLQRSGDFSVIKVTPAHLDLLATQIPEHADSRTHAFVIGGEALRSDTVEFWRQKAPSTTLFNEYGPTETVVGCCAYEVTERDRATRSDVPIGRPVANTELYVLDGHMQLAPIGVPGELYIGGDGVARGYVNQPAMTATTFVADPFTKRSGRRLYRTGDLVKYREDGNLEFLGRVDDQIKIRGFRVELGEIASALRQHATVDSAVAVAAVTVQGDRQIVAYVTPQHEARPDTDLKAHLRERLPDYMVPSKIIWLKQLPLTPNGKVDRRALSNPNGPSAPQKPYAPPRSASEAKLAAIWAEVLSMDRVGIDENFFELGGHSLKIFQLAARVQAAFGVKLSMRAFFDAPTIAEQIVAIAMKQAELTRFQHR